MNGAQALMQGRRCRLGAIVLRGCFREARATEGQGTRAYAAAFSMKSMCTAVYGNSIRPSSSLRNTPA